MLFRIAIGMALLIAATSTARAQYGCVPGYVTMGCPPPASMQYRPYWQQQQPAAQPSAPSAPIRSGEDIDDEMSDWCEDQTKASSIVICADSDLRQMALIRNKIFADAKAMLSDDAYKQLLSDQTQWVKTYSSSCGIQADGPEPSQPISSTIIGCFKREGQKRIIALVERLSQQRAGYRPSSLSSAQTALVDQALRQQEEADRAERERQQAQAAELARAQLHAQAIADRQAAINQKLRDEGAKLLSPVDFDLDWRDLRSGTHKVAIEGKYMEADDVEGLMLSNNDMPLVRLYTDDASRDARKAMLECRNSNYAAASCQLIIAGSVVTCIRNKGEYNEKEVPCLHVDDAFVDPTIDR